MAKEKIELSLQDESGQECVAYPFVESTDVSLSNGMDIETMIAQDVSLPTIVHSETSFKAGVGDSNISSSIVDSSVANMTIKGQTYQNILPEPSTHVLSNNKEMFKVNEGLDPNVEIVDGVSKSAILRGNTLVNILNGNVSINENVPYHDYKTDIEFKANTVYTAIFKVESEATSITCGLLEDGGTWNGGLTDVRSGYNKVLLTPSTTKTYGLRIRHFDGTSVAINTSDVMLIEGDYTNQEIPYFEGMQSVKMPVLTATGKNLFDVSKLEGLHENIEMIPNGIRVKNMQIDITRCFANPFKENTQYTFSFNHTQIEGEGREGFRFYYTDGTNSYAIPQSNSSFVGSSSANKTIKSISLSFNNEGKSELTNIQLEEGSTATSYEPFKTNILTVNEPIELRGIGEVQDTLDLITGEMIENFESFTFNGSEDWRLQDDSLENTTRFILLNYAPNKVNNQKIGITNTYEWGIIDEDKPGIVMTKPSGHVYLRTSKMSVDELKTMLSNNPIHGYYNKEKSIKTVDLSSSGNWEKIVFDGSDDEGWAVHSSTSNLTNCLHLYCKVEDLMKNTTPFSNFFQGKVYGESASSDDERIMVGGSYHIHINILKSRLDSNEVTSFKQWLSQNPLTVWYQTTAHKDSTQVKQPIFFKDGHIQLSSGVDNSLIPTLDYQAKTSNSYVMDLMKTNTKYTMKAKSASGTFTIDGTSYGAGTNGTFTTPSSMTNKFLVMSNNANEEIMILEGDVTDKTIPYFKGIKSAFENESKIEVLSTGKNLFDGELEIGSIGDSTGENTSNNIVAHKRTVNYIPVKGNQKIHIAFDSANGYTGYCKIYYYDKDKKFTTSIQNVSVNYTDDVNKIITTPNKTSIQYMRLRFFSQDGVTESRPTNIMVVASDKIATYEPYKQNITKIPLLSPLRSLPNGVKDEVILDRENHKVKIIQRIGKVVLDSSYFKYVSNTLISDAHSIVLYPNNMKQNWDRNKILVQGIHNVTSSENLVIRAGAYPNLNNIVLWDRIVCSAQDFTNEYINTLIYYELATPIITEIDLEGFPYIYKDGHIFLNTDIAPTSEIKYSINQSHMIEASNEDLMRHEKKITNLHKLIGTYVNVEYESTLLALNLELK